MELDRMCVRAVLTLPEGAHALPHDAAGTVELKDAGVALHGTSGSSRLEAGVHIVFPGNLQGWHVGETGSEGCDARRLRGRQGTEQDPRCW